MEMTYEEVHALLQPVVDALRGPDVLNIRLHITEKVTIHSPLKIRCEIEVEW